MGSSQQRNTNHNKKIKWNFKMRIHYPKEKKITAAAAKSLQLCPTLCDPIDGSPPGSPIPGILQARTLEWVAMSFSNAWKWKVKAKSLSCVRFLVTPWTAAYQAPPSLGFSRQDYWRGVPLPSLLEQLPEVNTRKYSCERGRLMPPQFWTSHSPIRGCEEWLIPYNSSKPSFWGTTGGSSSHHVF